MDDRRDGDEQQERQARVSGEPISSTASSTHNLRKDNSVPGLSKLSPPPSRHQSTLSPGTPSTRTGPPASLNFSLNRRRDSYFQERHESMDPSWMIQSSQSRPTLQQVDTEFRSALEYADPEQRQAEREMVEKRERKRLSRIQGEDYWKPLRLFADSPKDDGSDTDLPRRSNPPTRQHSAHDGFATPGPSRLQTVESVPGQDQMPDHDTTTTAPGAPPKIVKRSSSLPQMRKSTASRPSGAPARWTRLRSLLPNIVNASAAVPSNAVVHHSVNITDELIAGGLSTLMLQLWFDRDERGHRRVPILLHRLRVRISDSLYPMSGNKAVFRIECEYANGAARWVIYRQLRDFVSLHTHYTVSNAYNRLQDHIPEFPRTSLPYFKFLNTQRNDEMGKTEFAKLQRESLENYLLGLIRAVMFHPSANRLSGFLEISALSIAMAQSEGAQYKAGFLRIEVVGSKGSGFGRRAATWREKRKAKWCAVRESYLVVVEEPGDLTIWDVFLLDTDFKIERPTRYFRQGLNLLHPDTEANMDDARGEIAGRTLAVQHDARSRRSLAGTIRRSVSKVFHSHRGRSASVNGDARTSGTGRNRSNSASSNSSSSSTENEGERGPGPAMLDPSINVNPLVNKEQGIKVGHGHGGKNKKTGEVSKHTFYIENSQTRLKLYAKNERQMLQWIAAFEKIAATSHYLGGNRFNSFAPIRLNVAAQWLVDGRDYFWNLSRAILLAKESVYIHDWWLSPELQLRRPGKEKYRLDKLLERKAKEGVKIYVILYLEVSNRTTPTDSNYAKQTLQGLHENVYVQRSPSHFQTGTFYWAHHEKMCVVDETIAFMGGLDACFGRWDTAQHGLVDDDDNGAHIWPGKDYSNPRVFDFHNLNKPFEDMYDRSKVPRMPWHDISMQLIGQPARDLARHFVQRWNWLLRIKNHSRSMPFLLPPPEFLPGELTKMGLTGTCEVQICRSAGPWSLGTPQKVEHSIQTAYLKAIQMSDHFVYIENQFFISSTMVGDVKVENQIGDALVERAIRAYREKTPWRCCIMIPLLPGFTFPVDHSDASAIRIILECQNRTLFRGPHSIYGRLRKEGIDPENYVTVFSLRNWAKLRGEVLTTEQVYIHAKVCIVDDRLAIIGSANINERSQKGDRDSELAAIIRDTDMLDCTMAGRPYKVGRFAHTLRVRLMREHLGVDVDALDEANPMANAPEKPEHEQEVWDPEQEEGRRGEEGVTHVGHKERRTAMTSLVSDATNAISEATRGAEDVGSKDLRMLTHEIGLSSGKMDGTAGDKALQDERTTYTRTGEKDQGFASAVVPTLEEKVVGQHTDLEAVKASSSEGQGRTATGELYGAPADAKANDSKPPHGSGAVLSPNEEKAPAARSVIRDNLTAGLDPHGAWTLPTPAPDIDIDGFEDPLADSFWMDMWLAGAVHNTEIFRKVFHAIPDDLVTTWKQYKEFVAHHERLNKPAKEHQENQGPIARMPSETADEGAPGHNTVAETEEPHEETKVGAKNTVTDYNDEHKDENGIPPEEADAAKRRPAKGDEPFDQWERDAMEKLLGELRGHLVVFPTRFLEGEDIANNFLFNADRMLPLPIYN